MTKKNPKIAAELEALLLSMDEHPDVAAAQPVDEARKELRAMGLDTAPAEHVLKTLIDSATHTTQPDPEEGDDGLRMPPPLPEEEFALAASDAVRVGGSNVRFARLGSVCIAGEFRLLLTDGSRVAVLLHANEEHSSLWFDGDQIPVRAVTQGVRLALLTDFGIADAELLMRQMQSDSGKHCLRWDQAR